MGKKSSGPWGPWGKAPRSILRDSSLTLTARLLMLDLLERVGDQPSRAISRRTLAADLGVSLSTLDRAIHELVEAGLLACSLPVEGRVTHYKPTPPEASSVVTHDEGVSSPMTRGVVTHDDANKQDFLEIDSKQAQQPESLTRSKPSESAADTRASRQKATRDPVLLGDPLAIFDVLMRLPEHLKPQQTSQVLDAITQALSRGWTPESLSDAIKAEITNPRAGAGLTVKVLLSLSQQPPQEHKQEQQQSPQRSSPRPEDRPDLSELIGTGTPELNAQRAAEIRQSLAGAKRS